MVESSVLTSITMFEPYFGTSKYILIECTNLTFKCCLGSKCSNEIFLCPNVYLWNVKILTLNGPLPSKRLNVNWLHLNVLYVTDWNVTKNLHIRTYYLTKNFQTSQKEKICGSCTINRHWKLFVTSFLCRLGDNFELSQVLFCDSFDCHQKMIVL